MLLATSTATVGTRPGRAGALHERVARRRARGREPRGAGGAGSAHSQGLAQVDYRSKFS